MTFKKNFIKDTEVCSNKIKSKMPSKLAYQVAFHIGLYNPQTCFLRVLSCKQTF